MYDGKRILFTLAFQALDTEDVHAIQKVEPMYIAFRLFKARKTMIAMNPGGKPWIHFKSNLFLWSSLLNGISDETFLNDHKKHQRGRWNLILKTSHPRADHWCRTYNFMSG